MSNQKKTKRTTIRWVKRILLVLGSLAIVVAIVRAMLPQSIPVDVTVASRGALSVEVREDGQTRVRDRFVIAAPISGELERIPVEAGNWVDPDTIVARIQPPHAQLLDDRTRGETAARLAAARARERQAQTAIIRAQQAKDLAVQEADRTRTLFAKGAVPGAERDRTDLAEKL